MARNMLLEVSGLEAGYGALEVLHGIQLHVEENELVSIIGPNGCGKSTILRGLMGLTGWVRGNVAFDGQTITGKDTNKIVEGGVGYVPQLANVFFSMTVAENLALGGYLLTPKERDEQVDKMLDLFPKFKERRKQAAGTMSGGERQSLALAMALMTSPKLVLLDEPSAGLSPIATDEMYDNIVKLPADMGTAVLIVEQDVHGVLQITERTYVMKMGENDFDAPSKTVWEDDRVREAYLGNIADD